MCFLLNEFTSDIFFLFSLQLLQGGKRSDGRYADGIRPINSRCGLLPRAHGSALFTRGETQVRKYMHIIMSIYHFIDIWYVGVFGNYHSFQALAVVTLGDKQMAQRIDNLVGDGDVKSFYLQVWEEFFLIICIIIKFGNLPKQKVDS